MFVGPVQENSQQLTLESLVEIRTPDHAVAQFPPSEPYVTGLDTHVDHHDGKLSHCDWVANRGAVYMCLPRFKVSFRLFVFILSNY